MKQRSERRKLLVSARMRTDAGWSDVAITNASMRGLGLQTADAPPRGTYVEIRRGQLTINARVVWSNNHRFGVQTQDPVPIAALSAKPGEIAAPDARAADFAAGGGKERRRSPRVTVEAHEQSRIRSRLMEYSCHFIFAAAAVAIAASAVDEVFARQVATVERALAGK